MKNCVNHICENALAKKSAFSLISTLTLMALLIISAATPALAHENENREYFVMRTPYRHLLLSPLPSTTDGVMDIEKVILDSSVAKKPNLTFEMDWHLSMVIYALQQDDAYSVEQYWIGFLNSIKNNEIHVDINAVMYWVMREAFIDPNIELSFAASRYKSSLDAMKIVSDELDREIELYESLLPVCSDNYELCREVSSSGNVMALIFFLMKEQIDEANETKKYFLGKLELFNKIAESMAEYLKRLAEEAKELAGKVKTPMKIKDDDRGCVNCEPE